MLKVNIAGEITYLTRDELDRYLFDNPEYNENYFIIDEF